jgi:hypothetical protein
MFEIGVLKLGIVQQLDKVVLVEVEHRGYKLP